MKVMRVILLVCGFLHGLDLGACLGLMGAFFGFLVLFGLGFLVGLGAGLFFQQVLG